MITAQQLENHKKFITGSKVASILNLPGAYQSKYELFAQMKGYAESNIEETERMKAGAYMELGIEAWCHGEWGWELQKMEGATHPKYPFMYALIDRVRIQNGNHDAVIEFKNVDKFVQKQWDDGIPDKFKTQVYFYMNMLDLPGVVVACFGGNHFEKYEMPRHPQTENFIIKKCCEFWDDLQNDRWPQVDGSESCAETLKKLYPDHTKDLAPGTEEILNTAISYERTKAAIDNLEITKMEYANKLRGLIADKSGFIWTDGSKVTWNKTNPKKVKFDEAQFEREYPDLYNRYCSTPEGYRVLRVSVKGVEI